MDDLPSPSHSLAGKTALVTGASRGIGAAIAQALAGAGARVGVHYSSHRAGADAVVARIAGAGGQAVALGGDLRDAAQAAALFDAAEQQLGRVDLLVNNAGIAIYKAIADTGDDDFDRLFATNVRGVFLMLRQAATRLADGGAIVNLSSSVTRLMMPTYGIYSASKAAVEQLTRVFAKEVGGRGIRVNSVSPGPTNTELFTQGKSEETIRRLAGMAALGRIGETDDIARTVLFLLGPQAGWITAQNLGANGGFA